MAHTRPTQINQKRFSRLFSDTIPMGEGMRFCFAIGAGASKSAGVPTGEEMAKRWYQQILEDLDQHELEQWKTEAKACEGEFKPSQYQIFKKRFQYSPEIGSRELQAYINKAEPGLGYMMLARIMQKTQHNFLISTNFDKLIEIALLYTTGQLPLVCIQEPLNAQIISQKACPVVIKTHRDLMFSPYFSKEVSAMPAQCQQTLRAILQKFNLVVIGSGGNDNSFLNFLESVPAEQRQSVFWCTQQPATIHPRVDDFLTDKDFIVAIDSFDEMMYQLSSIFDINEIVDPFDTNNSPLVKQSKTRAKQYATEYNQLAGIPGDDEIDALLADLDDEFPEIDHELDLKLSDRAADELVISESTDDAAESGNNPKAMSSLEKLIAKTTDSPVQTSPEIELSGHDEINALMDDLLNSSSPVKKQHNNPQYHLDQLTKEPDSCKHHAYYALFLERTSNDLQEADHHFVEALNQEPEHPEINGLYAYFLINSVDECDKAELHYQQALAAEPENATLNVLYAIFLQNIRKEYIRAEQYFRKAWDADITGASYSNFIKEIRRDYEAAANYYREALELNLDNKMLSHPETTPEIEPAALETAD